MRTSLSCDHCRRSKVKCVNSGSAPCQRCERLRHEKCALSRPRHQVRAKDRGEFSVSPGQPPGVNHGNRALPLAGLQDSCLPALSHHQGREAVPATTEQSSQRLPPAGTDHHDIENHLARMPSEVVLNVMNIFINKFPELSFLHLPTFMDKFQTACSGPTKVLLSAILALSRHQLCVVSSSWVNTLLPKECYALYAEEMLTKFLLQPPKLEVVQALLAMALLEWGSREFHKAWVYCGTAIRIMQAIHSLRIASDNSDAVFDGTNDAVSRGIENRSYWACFIMDCMITSGTYHPRMLPMKEMEKSKVTRPLNVVEFAFGEEASSALLNSALVVQQPPSSFAGILDITQSFEILVNGFDIWSQVMNFVLNDGRRAPGMTAPENCPWVSTSAWARLKQRVHDWRASQHPRLYYPENTVAIHMTLGYGESFLYLNLLYYLNILHLEREYFPFIPKVGAVPCGPSDPPLLEAEAPEGWWQESAAQLFNAAEQIANILHEAQQCGISLMTPFVGFSCYSACFLHLYVLHFPSMNLGRSERARELFNLCLDYLKKFLPTCNLGDRWLKTINHSMLLYQKITQDRRRYSSKSRADFNVLHRSVHEFRIIDRSNQHLNEISTAEMDTSPSMVDLSAEGDSNHQSPEINMALEELFAETVNNTNELSNWPYWWCSIEDRDTTLFENS